MKRVLSLLLTAAMLIAVFAFAGCGGTTVDTTTPAAENTSASTSGSSPAEQTTPGGSEPEATTTESTTPGEETTGSVEPPISTDPFGDYDGTTKLPGFESVDFRC